MSKLRGILVVTSLLTLGALGCTATASAGQPFDPTHVNEIQKGTHDKAQIQAWFGQPFKVVAPLQGNPAGCVERWLYVHSVASATGATVTAQKTNTLVVDFDAAGKVCDKAFVSK